MCLTEFTRSVPRAFYNSETVAARLNFGGLIVNNDQRATSAIRHKLNTSSSKSDSRAPAKNQCRNQLFVFEDGTTTPFSRREPEISPLESESLSAHIAHIAPIYTY